MCVCKSSQTFYREISKCISWRVILVTVVYEFFVGWIVYQMRTWLLPSTVFSSCSSLTKLFVAVCDCRLCCEAYEIMLFWDITQLNVVIPYWCFGKTFLDTWPFEMGLISCPETSVRNDYYALYNVPEEPGFIYFLLRYLCISECH